MSVDDVMIRVEHLSKRYGNNPRPAVDDISFQVGKGEVLGFVGPNGAGKTTTMKILTSYLAPSDGRAQIAGLDVYEDSVEARRHIGYLPEDTPLYRDMSVLEYLEWVARVRKIPTSETRQRIKRVTEQCAVDHRLGSLIGELSKGYRQRVGLAQAILHDPEVLILDEPTSGLDPNQIVEIRNVIKEFGRQKTVIFSTHILAEVQATCSRVLVISDGKIVADATPADLGDVLSREHGIQLIVDFGSHGEAVREALGRIPGVTDVKPFVTDGVAATPGRFLVSASASMPQGLDLRQEISRTATEAKAPLLELTRHAPLEDVFRHLTRAPQGAKSAASPSGTPAKKSEAA